MEQGNGKAATKAKNKYNATNYDSLRIVVPKGQKEAIRLAAMEKGESVNAYVQRAILNRMGCNDWRKDKDE